MMHGEFRAEQEADGTWTGKAVVVGGNGVPAIPVGSVQITVRGYKTKEEAIGAVRRKMFPLETEAKSKVN